MADEVTPFPKAVQLARGERRYRRKVASPKQWQAIIAAKGDTCRLEKALIGVGCSGEIQYHHLVSRSDGGDDVADNIIPLCEGDHDHLTRRTKPFAWHLLAELSDAEYAYMIQRGGEDYPERAYGISYGR